MANITIRNIPEDIFERIRTLSSVEKRSLNSELLMIMERGLEAEVALRTGQSGEIAMSTQLKIWEQILGQWEDHRTTQEIVADIYEHRTLGRPVDL